MRVLAHLLASSVVAGSIVSNALGSLFGLSSAPRLEEWLGVELEFGAERLLSSVPAHARSAWETVLAAGIPGAETYLAALIEAQKLQSSGDPSPRPIAEKHSVGTLRVNEPRHLGLAPVKQYAGYFDIDESDKHFFYWFFESQNDPTTDPVILWLSGGPGSSSLTVMLGEMGPSFIDDELAPYNNPHTWNKNASIIFLDQPVGVGYSYSDSPEKVDTTPAAASDTFAFLDTFFAQFPEYAASPLHISGSSYAGHYIPAIGSEVLSRDFSERSFNLSSVIIGNPFANPYVQDSYYEPMACGQGGVPAVLDRSACRDMHNAMPQCMALNEGCSRAPSKWSCWPAYKYCNYVVLNAYEKTGQSKYDMRVTCGGDPDPCKAELGNIDAFLNLQKVKKAVGVADDFEYKDFSEEVYQDFLATGDWQRSFADDLGKMLDAGIPALIYAGDKDYICNWLGVEAWTRVTPWKQQPLFQRAARHPFVLSNGSTAGHVRNTDIFTFVRIFDAGHVVPLTQPRVLAELVSRWLEGDYTLLQ